MGLLRALYKSIFTASIISCFFFTNSIISIILITAPFKRRSFLSKLNRIYASMILRVLNFKITLNGELPKKGALIIGNHMSYLDILIYLSFFETLFVTSVDMKRRAFLGQITVLGGCLYVERRNPKNLPKELASLKKFFKHGFSVCIFPEGTSTNGETVLPFKKSLFQIAFQTDAPIQPVVLKYQLVNNEPFSKLNCDKVCWYGGLRFLPHLFNLFSLKSVSASLDVLSSFESTDFTDRKTLADHTHRLILKQYHKK